jgi:hypothetical protein
VRECTELKVASEGEDISVADETIVEQLIKLLIDKAQNALSNMHQPPLVIVV